MSVADLAGGVGVSGTSEAKDSPSSLSEVLGARRGEKVEGAEAGAVDGFLSLAGERGLPQGLLISAISSAEKTVLEGVGKREMAGGDLDLGDRPQLELKGPLDLDRVVPRDVNLGLLVETSLMRDFILKKKCDVAKRTRTEKM